MKRLLVPEFLETGDRAVVSHNVPIRDAATLLLMDRTDKRPKLLVGRRRDDLAFMPGLYVLPGGSIDKADAMMSFSHDLDAATLQRLQLRASKLSKRQARALALAAIRETYEESGVLLGIKQKPAAVPDSWQAFADHGVMPDLMQLKFIARAVTPPYRPRRFDTRFFMADSSAIAHALPSAQRIETDLHATEWLTYDEVLQRPLAFITRQILTDLVDIFDAKGKHDYTAPVPYYHVRGNQYYCELIG